MDNDDKGFEVILKHLNEVDRKTTSIPSVSASFALYALLPVIKILVKKAWAQEKEIAAIKQLLADRGIVRGPGL